MCRSVMISSIIICAFTVIMASSVEVFAADDSLKNVLPPRGCVDGWIMEDKVSLYTRDTLFEYINGEAELYFPYGFDMLATATYTNRVNPQVAIAADVYRMASLLNAFGIYSNYRRVNAAGVAVGAEGFVSSSQLMFYQDRYFVRLQASGTSNVEKDIFLACGRAVSQNLPLNANPPRELEALKIPAVVPKSERYIAQSLLGYAFFRQGIIADAMLEGERVQVFVVTEASRNAARQAFDQYHAYLRASGQDVQCSESPDRISVSAVDPLYRGVLVEQSGRYILGAVRLKETSAAKQLVEELRRRFLPQATTH